jgi:hypothetical protein
MWHGRLDREPRAEYAFQVSTKLTHDPHCERFNSADCSTPPVFKRKPPFKSSNPSFQAVKVSIWHVSSSARNAKASARRVMPKKSI